MHITCKNIQDFCELIHISVGQDIKEKTLFISYKSSYPSIYSSNTPKDHHSFTYVFFTPLYTAIYSGNIKSTSSNTEYELLKETCSKYEIRIHNFDKLKYDSDKDTLLIGTHTEVI